MGCDRGTPGSVWSGEDDRYGGGGEGEEVSREDAGATAGTVAGAELDAGLMTNLGRADLDFLTVAVGADVVVAEDNDDVSPTVAKDGSVSEKEQRQMKQENGIH